MTCEIGENGCQPEYPEKRCVTPVIPVSETSRDIFCFSSGMEDRCSGPGETLNGLNDCHCREADCSTEDPEQDVLLSSEESDERLKRSGV